jgi:hypothetical protein
MHNGILELKLLPYSPSWTPVIRFGVHGVENALFYQIFEYDRDIGFLVEKCVDDTRVLFYDKRLAQVNFTDGSISCPVAEISDYQFPNGKHGCKFPALIPETRLQLSYESKQRIISCWNNLNSYPTTPFIIMSQEEWNAQQHAIMQQQQQALGYAEYIAHETFKKVHGQLILENESLRQFLHDIDQAHKHNFASITQAKIQEALDAAESIETEKESSLVAKTEAKEIKKAPKPKIDQQMTELFIAYLDNFDRDYQKICLFFYHNVQTIASTNQWRDFFNHSVIQVKLTIYMCEKILLSKSYEGSKRNPRVPNIIKNALLQRVVKCSDAEYDACKQQRQFALIANQVGSDYDLKLALLQQFEKHKNRTSKQTVDVDEEHTEPMVFSSQAKLEAKQEVVDDTTERQQLLNKKEHNLLNKLSAHSNIELYLLTLKMCSDHRFKTLVDKLMLKLQKIDLEQHRSIENRMMFAKSLAEDNLFELLKNRELKVSDLRAYAAIFDLANSAGQTVLMLAMQNHLPEAVLNFIIDKSGVTIIAGDSQNNTVLHYWAKHYNHNLNIFEKLYRAFGAQKAIELRNQEDNFDFFLNSLQEEVEQKTFMHVLFAEVKKPKMIAKVLKVLLDNEAEDFSASYKLSIALAAKDIKMQNIYTLLELKNDDWNDVKESVLKLLTEIFNWAINEVFETCKNTYLLDNSNLIDFFNSNNTDDSNVMFATARLSDKALRKVVLDRLYLRSTLNIATDEFMGDVLMGNDFVTAICYYLHPAIDNQSAAKALINMCLQCESSFSPSGSSYDHMNLLQSIFKLMTDHEIEYAIGKYIIDQIFEFCTLLGDEANISKIINHLDFNAVNSLYYVLNYIVQDNYSQRSIDLLKRMVTKDISFTAICEYTEKNILHRACDLGYKAVEIMLHEIAKLDQAIQSEILNELDCDNLKPLALFCAVVKNDKEKGVCTPEEERVLNEFLEMCKKSQSCKPLF